MPKKTTKKKVELYLREVIGTSSVEVCILRELIQAKFPNSTKANEALLLFLEEAVKEHVTPGASDSTFSVCAAKGIMCLKNKTESTVAEASETPRELVTAATSFCDDIHTWMMQQLSLGAVSIHVIHQRINSMFANDTDRILMAKGCLSRYSEGTSPIFVIVQDFERFYSRRDV